MKRTIICDAGINFMSSLSVARRMISDIADCGGTIAKFQWYDAEALFNDPEKDTYRPDIYENVKDFMLDEHKIEQLMKWCEFDGIEFGCSVFDEGRFRKLDYIGVSTHKIASRVSRYDRDLAVKILETGKPTYVSLGFDAEPFDTDRFPNCLHLYCVAKYPSEHTDFDLPADFRETIYNGFSSHAMDPYPAMVALARGAGVIEVHYTLDKSLGVLNGGYDHICSLDKSELRQLCNFAKKIEKIY